MTALLLIPDGGEGVLATAQTPALDALPYHASIQTVPATWPVASQVALPGLLGVRLDEPPARGPVEAASLGIPVGADEAAWRLDMTGSVSRPNPAAVAADLGAALGATVRHLRRTRFVLVGPAGWLGDGANATRERIATRAVGEPVRIWGGGLPAQLPTVPWATAVVAAPTGAAAGIARMTGADVISPNAATGFADTDMRGKATAAKGLLDLGRHDVVVVHVGAIDEAGHAGDSSLQIVSAQRFDREILGPLVTHATGRSVDVVVAPDHATDARTRSHVRGAVRVRSSVPVSGGDAHDLLHRIMTARQPQSMRHAAGPYPAPPDRNRHSWQDHRAGQH